MKNFKAYLAILIAMIIWSASFIFTKMGLLSFHPMTVVAVRMTLAVTILWIYTKLSNRLQKIDKKDYKLFLVAGFVQPFCYFVCEAFGLTMVSSTVASVILSTIPLFAPFFAFFMLREKVTWNNILGIIISMIGVWMVIVEKGSLVMKPLGLFLLCICVVAAILYTVFLRRIPSNYNSSSIVFYVHAISLCFFIPTFVVVDIPKIFSGDFFISHDISILYTSIGAILVLAIFASVIGYILFASGCRIVGVTRSNAFCNIMPGCTALIVWLMGGAAPNTIKITGIAVVILGLFIGQAHFNKKKKTLIS